jgi:DNA-binding transcriptional LysR family regulator
MGPHFSYLPKKNKCTASEHSDIFSGNKRRGPIKDVNSDHLQLFAKVVQTGSFTRAADALDTQKSYVSRVVAQLEAELGVKLLERTTRSLALTEVGREVYERAVGIVGAMDDTLRIAQQSQGEPRGLLRLTCGVEFGLLAVGGWIDEYLARHPQVSVEAEYTSRVLDLVHEGFDIAIRIGQVQESRLVARQLGQLEYGLFATPQYLRRNGTPAEPAELREHALIMFAPGGRRTAWELSLGHAEETQRIAGQARLRVNNSFAVRDALLRGLGIGQLPLLVAAQAGTREHLARVLPDWSGAPASVHAVYPSSRYLAPKVRAFIDLALARLPQAADTARGARFARR